MEKKFHTKHIPVLLPSVLDILDPKPGDVIVDATLGGGGYAEALLERVLPNGKVIAFDWDTVTLARFMERVKETPWLAKAMEDKILLLVQANYADIAEKLSEIGIAGVDAIVADLGLSSDQLEDETRGLSFQTDSPLDMRLNSDETVTAEKMINGFSEEELSTLFRVYGDETESKKIASAIVRKRNIEPITRTSELAELIEGVVSKRRLYERIHPATKVFQALRMAVNSERQALERFLPEAVKVVKSGGKIALVTFHSGEDAIVKHFFKDAALGCTCGLVPCICGRKTTLKILTKKPLLPTDEEVRDNPRARSAKLRAVQKIG